MTPRSFTDSRRWMRHGTALFASQTDLGDSALSQPSALPGWTRKHVVAHVAANADALGNLLRCAATGQPTPMYASPVDRAAGIERGSALPARDLTTWLLRSADALDEAMTRLSGEQWQAFVVTRCCGRPSMNWPRRRSPRRPPTSMRPPGSRRRRAAARRHIPESYGGEGADALAAVIIIEEATRACAASSLIPRSTSSARCRFCCPDRRTSSGKYLPPVARGEALFSDALSEAGARSDAAEMKTCAVRDGDWWVLNGTKMWITNAGVPQYYTLTSSSA